MQTEYEAKFYPVNKERIRKKLRQLGAELVVPERKMVRIIFDRVKNPRIKGNYLRIRDEGGKVTMSVKVHARSDGVVEDQKEAFVVVEDFDQAVAVVKAAGFIQTNYQESLRETWEFDGAEIEIDTWPDLKPYVEIEAESEEKVKEVAQKLGFDWDKKIITGVMQIYMKVYNLSEREAWQKTKRLIFKK